ncbi:uncharacterized protein LOC132195083 isoform X2 [Neocloeon triangulifer]|uniref:uncharacterized protein LOC132195083 isoform X2 n=1 Tax=Neocloeon triangulifer TaxID=2078957 RepID=UPI00286EFC93|nr:uncharacterized protein LOC132195083 isoform X2 [Neocloeon triangulifer]
MLEVELRRLSDDDFALLREAIKAERWRRTSIPKLKKLCAQEIFRNWSKYLTNPVLRKKFNTIPDYVVQNILAELKAADLNFIILLCNEFVANFDFQILKNNEKASSFFDSIARTCVVLRHMQKNCPKITCVKLQWPTELQFDVPLDYLAPWRGLKFLAARDFIFSPQSILLLTKNHVKLECLEMGIFVNQFDSPDVFAEMKSLKYLYVLGTLPSKEKVKRFRERMANQLFATIAAAAPNVKRFHCELSEACPSRSSDGFVEKWISLEKSDRNVCLLGLQIFNLTCTWPANGLTVEKLTIFGDLLDSNPDTVRNVLTIPTANLQRLDLREISETSFVFKILKYFGAKIEHLGLFWKRPPEDLNLYKILNLCRNLRKISVDEFATTEEMEGFELTADYFTKIESFDFYRCKSDNVHVIDRQHNVLIFKMFLLNSEAIKTRLSIFAGEMLSALLDALVSNPNCLKDIEELNFNVQCIMHTFFVEKILDVMIQRAPRLHTFNIKCQEMINAKKMRSLLSDKLITLVHDLNVSLNIVDKL